MKIVFPTQEDRQLESSVHGHYGSAEKFILVDSESGATETLVNQDRDHIHGQCQPLKAIGERRIDAVVVGGIGRGALNKLKAAGITVYRAVEGNVAENLALVKAAKLPQFDPAQTCAGHQHGVQIGGCAH